MVSNVQKPATRYTPLGIQGLIDMSRQKSILEQAKYYLAEKLIVKEYVDDTTAKERRAVCADCPHRDTEEDKCLKCGCFLELKTRSRVNWRVSRNRNEITHCPLGKWGDVETANFYRGLDGLEPITEN